MDWRKAAAWTAGGIVAVAAAGAVAFHTPLDSDTLARRAAERAKAAWGRDLVAESLHLQLLPRPALRGEGVSLSNPDWAKERQFLVARAMTFNFQLLPLLLGKVQVTSIFLED